MEAACTSCFVVLEIQKVKPSFTFDSHIDVWVSEEPFTLKLDFRSLYLFFFRQVITITCEAALQGLYWWILVTPDTFRLQYEFCLFFIVWLWMWSLIWTCFGDYISMDTNGSSYFIGYGLSEYITHCSEECLVHRNYLLIFFPVVTFSYFFLNVPYWFKCVFMCEVILHKLRVCL